MRVAALTALLLLTDCNGYDTGGRPDMRCTERDTLSGMCTQATYTCRGNAGGTMLTWWQEGPACK